MKVQFSPVRERQDMRFLSFYTCIVLVILFFFIFQSLYANENEDERQISFLVEELNSFSSVHNIPPNDNDFYEIVFKKDGRLSSYEMSKVLLHLVQMQHPSVTKRELQAIYNAKIKSIGCFRFDYTTITSMFSDGKKDGSIETEEVFVMKGNKIFKDISKQKNTSLVDRRIASFDGEYVYKMNNPTDVVQNVTIDYLSDTSHFFELNMPLCQAMLIDTKNFGFPSVGFDFLLFLESKDVHIFQKYEIVDGIECVIVANQNLRVLVDPVRDYSIIRIEWLQPDIKGSSGKCVP